MTTCRVYPVDHNYIKTRYPIVHKVFIQEQPPTAHVSPSKSFSKPLGMSGYEYAKHVAQSLRNGNANYPQK